MSPDPFTMPRDCPFPLPSSRQQAGSLSLTWKLSLLVLTLIVLVTLSLQSFAMDMPPLPMAVMNHALPGMRMGILTKAQGTVLSIDHTTYTLAPTALVEDKFGTALTVKDIQCHDVEYRVRYWVVTDKSQNQIMQMIVTFPE
ncbi:MAG TPA: hypothetical protein VGJ57_05105 [Nitrospirales bacterium]